LSRGANDLRNDLIGIRYFETTPDEFRAMFRATDTIDQKLLALTGATDFGSAQEREALIKQRDDALKTALGPKRYEEYVRMHDPRYREAYASAQQGGDPNAAGTLYEINTATAEEMNRLRAGSNNITAQQLAIELKKAELEQLKATAEALGQTVPKETPPQPPAPPQTVHRLIAGESLARLAQLYGVDVNVLRAANPGVNLDQIRPGDAIKVPVPPPSSFTPIPIPRR
jgi:LysM repeat protein